MSQPKARRRGRPEKPDAEKRVQLRYSVTPATLERFERLVPKAERSKVLEEALTLIMNIKERRILPEHL